MSDPGCNYSTSSASSNTLLNLRSQSLPKKDLIEPTDKIPEANEENNDCIINGQSASIFPGYHFDATFIDRMKSQLLTSRKSNYNEMNCDLGKRRLSQPLMEFVNHRTKDVTLKKRTKNGMVKIVSDFMEKRRKSLPVVQISSQDAAFQESATRISNTIGLVNGILLDSKLSQEPQKSTPKETSSIGIVNGSFTVPSSSQPTLQTVAEESVPEKLKVSTPGRKRRNGALNGSMLDLKEPKESTPRKTKSIAIVNGTFTVPSSSLPNLQTVAEESISEKLKVSTPVRKRRNGALNGSLLDLKEPKESTPRKTKSIAIVNGIFTDYTSSRPTSQAVAEESVSEKPKVPTPGRKRRNGALNGSLLDLKEPQESTPTTPRKTKSIGIVNGIFTDHSSSQPTSQTVAEESVSEKLKVSTPVRKRRNGALNGSLLDLKEAKKSAPRRSRSIEKVNGALIDCRSTHAIPQILSQDSTRTVSSGIVSGALSDMSLSQPTLQKVSKASKEFTSRKIRRTLTDPSLSQPILQTFAEEAVPEGAKGLIPRQTSISTEKLNGTLTVLSSPQPILQIDHQISVSEEPKVSILKRTRRSSVATRIATESPLQISVQKPLHENAKKPTPKRTRKNGMVNGILTDDQSFKSTSQTVARSSVTENKNESTPKITRKNQKTNGLLSDYQSSPSTSQGQSSIFEATEELRPQMNRKNGIVNGIIIDSQSSQSTSPTVTEEIKESSLKRKNGLTNGILAEVLQSESVLRTPLLGTPNEKPNGVTLEKTPQNGVMRRCSTRVSVQETAQETVSVIQTPKKLLSGKPIVKLERLTFDANGTITWPKPLEGRRVDMQQALEDLNRYEEELQRAKRHYRKYRAPTKGKETYSKEYVVERIVDQEFDVETKTLMFLVQWEGYDLDHSTWEPLHHLQHCTLLLTQFLEKRLDSEVLDALCEKLNISSRLSDQNLLEILKVTDLNCLPDKILLQEKLLRLIATPPKQNHVRKIEDGKKAMLMYQLLLRREQQLNKLKAWENCINEMTNEEALITIENTVDLECPPEGFTYIHENIATNGIVIQSDSDRCCECEECGPRQDCCGKQPHNGFTYKTTNKINVNPGNAVYECNKKCKCSQDCRNRVVQNGRKVPLCIFRTSNGCGWGVKTMRKIYCGEFVCEYVGEIITHEEAEVRGRAYDQEGRTYLFDLDYNSKDNPYTVDAAKFGNISHFINHSCDPNLGVYAVWIDCDDPNMPRLALFALREIQRDEEITFDYMMNIDPEVPTTPEKPRFLHTPDKNQVIQNGRNICKCEADACRRYLF